MNKPINKQHISNFAFAVVFKIVIAAL